MASKLIRHYGRGHLHFITFTCYRRLPLLRSVRARSVFIKLLGEVRDRYGFSLVGYVVMPEHIQLLMSEPPPRFWQRRFYDFNVWLEEEDRKAPHAYESAEKKVGRSPQGSASSAGSTCSPPEY